MDTNTIERIFDSLRHLTFEIPDEVFQGIALLTKYVGYFFPLRLYLPIILLVLSMVFIQTAVKVIDKIAQIGTDVFKFFSSFKGK